jgi:hypothetical protein
LQCHDPPQTKQQSQSSRLQPGEAAGNPGTVLFERYKLSGSGVGTGIFNISLGPIEVIDFQGHALGD